MKIALLRLSLLLLAGCLSSTPTPPASAEPPPYENIDSIKAKIDRLSPRIPENFPREELEKLERWIEDYEQNPAPHRDLTLKKITAQLQYIQTIARRIDSEKEIRRLRSEIDSLRSQIEEIEETNQEVLGEVERLER